MLSKVATRIKPGPLLSCRSACGGSIRSSKRKQSTMAAIAAYEQSVETFPSIVIGSQGKVEPQGTFAEAQAQFLDPDPEAVKAVVEGMKASNMGIVAHYYMDVELQGVLHAVQRTEPDLAHRIGIADSLKMGDIAVDMCRPQQLKQPWNDVATGVDAVACLGVDFMSESVSAILDRNGFGHVPVYRATTSPIGCSLAESAEGDSYKAWLMKEGADANALHVVYINTSLETKAVSSSLVPTITCTSSNVVQTMLQASAQVGSSLKILYGPDTYMGNNLVTFFDSLLRDPSWTDARIASELHPQHNRQTLADLRNGINVYPHGNCVVHHMFGAEVVDTVLRDYDDAMVTAHLEVPGEMFGIAMKKSLEGKGITGSTSNILDFITEKVQEAANSQDDQRLKFILGTEAGMVTSVVKSVQDILRSKQQETGRTSGLEAEIIFPVASEAIMATGEGNGLEVVPGVAGGEGCSTAGGCATCPFMKMNSLDSLLDVMDMVATSDSKNEVMLRGHLPPDRLRNKSINGVSAMDWGIEPIMYMRDFMSHKALPKELVGRITHSS